MQVIKVQLDEILQTEHFCVSTRSPRTLHKCFLQPLPHPSPRVTVILTSSCVDILLALYHTHLWASLVAQAVKNMPEIWETHVLFLGWEDPLEEGMATQSSILAWGIP